ncbi:hypothetical protein AQS8620_01206 [Aquimixticola soesokkakensis]|uniref:Uncharacterized protein n=1 Tax=Aquimixticola soesokkakensis TaxID=1519096 RepID=A0A1Y5SD45_9RHOB|nr:hypothetical protein [Aquimixticola soesokkakensis]SLN35209.1 hypothetical protein AQS8620_01206 [Aquimixticola soesokkakensis]
MQQQSAAAPLNAAKRITPCPNRGIKQAKALISRALRVAIWSEALLVPGSFAARWFAPVFDAQILTARAGNVHRLCAAAHTFA